MGQIVDRNGGAMDPNAPSPLDISNHPIMAVICNELGAVCYQRLNAPDIVLGGHDPARSRKYALQRAEAVLARFKGDEHDMMRTFPISEHSGKGLTYNQLRDQTIEACEESRKIEKVRRRKFEEKMARYGIEE